MGWFDDLQARVEEGFSNVSKDINQYIAERVLEPVIKIGQPQGGNRTAAQIEAGQYGSAPSLVPAAAAPSQIQNAAQASQIEVHPVVKHMPLIVAGTLAVILLTGKRRGV